MAGPGRQGPKGTLASVQKIMASEDRRRRFASPNLSDPGHCPLLIVVRELGPKLQIGIPMLVKGGTELILEVRVLDFHTAKSVADVRTHGQNGGAFVIKGAKTLAQDMSAALRTILIGPATLR